MCLKHCHSFYKRRACRYAQFINVSNPGPIAK
jgi:hypothetical protein